MTIEQLIDSAPPLRDVRARLDDLLSQVGAQSALSTSLVLPAHARQARSKFEHSRGFGLYAFEIDERALYLGRAIGSTLGERVRSQCRSLGAKRWDAVILHERCRIHVLHIHEPHWPWAAAFETFLIREFRFPVNDRVS